MCSRFRRSIQSAFDGGGSSHSLKIPANITGLYGSHYSDASRIENISLNRQNSSSPMKNMSEMTNSVPEALKHDQSREDSERDDMSSYSSHREFDNSKAIREFSNDAASPAKSLFGQMEDAVTKAKLIAAQQFLLQNFQKQREALFSAQNISSISTLPSEENKKMFAPFPFSPLPFTLPPTSVHFSGFPNMPKNNNGVMESFPLKKEDNEEEEKIETESDVRDEESPKKSQRDNAFLLFSQIQKYRQQILESGNSKFSPDSMEPNIIRSCEKLVTPF